MEIRTYMVLIYLNYSGTLMYTTARTAWRYIIRHHLFFCKCLIFFMHIYLPHVPLNFWPGHCWTTSSTPNPQLWSLEKRDPESCQAAATAEASMGARGCSTLSSHNNTQSLAWWMHCFIWANQLCKSIPPSPASHYAMVQEKENKTSASQILRHTAADSSPHLEASPSSSLVSTWIWTDNEKERSSGCKVENQSLFQVSSVNRAIKGQATIKFSSVLYLQWSPQLHICRLQNTNHQMP